MDGGLQQSHPDARLRQYKALVEVAESIVAHRDLTSLLRDLKRRLRLLVTLDGAHLLLHDPERNVMRRHVLQSSSLLDDLPTTELAMDEAPGASVWRTQQPLLMTHLDSYDPRYLRIVTEMLNHGVKTAYVLPLTSLHRRLGALAFLSLEENAWSEDDRALLEQVTRLVALAVDNVINFESASAAKAALERRLEHLRLLLEVGKTIVSNLDLRSLIEVISGLLKSVIRCDAVFMSLCDADPAYLRVFALDRGFDGSAQSREGQLIPLAGTMAEKAIATHQTLLLTREDLESSESSIVRGIAAQGVKTNCLAPLISHGRSLGTISMASLRDDAFTPEDVELLTQIAGQIAIATENALNFERARTAEETARRESDRAQLLLDLNNAVASHLDLNDLMRAIFSCLRRVFPYDVVGLGIYDPEINQLRSYANVLPEIPEFLEDGEPIPLEGTIPGYVFRTGKPLLLDRFEDARFASRFSKKFYDAGFKSGGAVPLIVHDRTLGTLGVSAKHETHLSDDEKDLLCQVAKQMAIAVENSLNFERARRAEREVKRQLDRERLMLEINNAVVSILDLSDLVRTVSSLLRDVMPHDAAGIALYEPELNHLREYTNVSYKDVAAFREGDTIPLKGTPAGHVFLTGQPLLIRRPDLSKYPADQYSQLPVEDSPKSACLAPLISHGRKLGIVGVSSTQEEKFTEDDLELFRQLAEQIAIAVENALNFEEARKAENELRHRYERERLMLEINNAVVSELSLRELVRAISTSLRKAMGYDTANVALYDHEINQLRAYMLDLSDKLPPMEEGTIIPLEDSVGGLAFSTGQPIFINQVGLGSAISDFDRRMIEAGVQSGGVVPLMAHGRKLGLLGVGSFQADAFTLEDQELLGHIANQIAIAVENALAFQEIETLKNKLTSEKLYLEAEIRTEHNFEELIGSSPSFKRILKQVETVAPTESAVLIRGETGTGKELLARAIHNLSGRRERSLVKLNCAAIPTGLLESELFGHERGAFTGAISQRIGRFELAHKGTLFLDEVGDIPLELQPKLLRVLQEQEFERLGSTRTQKVDVRLIAATNCDLEQLVSERKYRSDLYYRLNVFPVMIPPLRERREDIPTLARFFPQKYAQRLKKRIESISAEAMTALTGYSWPGNVRELEHFIERAVVLTQGSELELSISELKPASPSKTTDTVSTLEAAERGHILRALEEAHWVIGGPNGAAARLGMKRTTLQSRMQKLGLGRSGNQA